MFLRIIAVTLTVSAAIACSSNTSPKSDLSTKDGGNKPKGDAGGTAKIGEPCPNGVSDCLPGLGCDGDDPGGGQCYGICTPHQDAECGDVTKFVCNVEGHCYPRCNTVADCPRASEGYVCKQDSPPSSNPGVMFCDAPD